MGYINLGHNKNKWLTFVKTVMNCLVSTPIGFWWESWKEIDH
jgi:hypothetical protein